MDLNQYIGIPYVLGGRDFSGTDCYGLVMMVYRVALGIELPDWRVDDLDVRTIARAMTNNFKDEHSNGRGYQVDEPEDFDIVLVHGGTAAHHIGVVVYGGVLHAAPETRTAWQSRGLFDQIYNPERQRFYRWRR